MKIEEAEEIITWAFQAASEEQFINQMEWLLNEHPILNSFLASTNWQIEGVP